MSLHHSPTRLQPPFTLSSAGARMKKYLLYALAILLMGCLLAFPATAALGINPAWSAVYLVFPLACLLVPHLTAAKLHVTGHEVVVQKGLQKNRFPYERLAHIGLIPNYHERPARPFQTHWAHPPVASADLVVWPRPGTGAPEHIVVDDIENLGKDYIARLPAHFGPLWRVEPPTQGRPSIPLQQAIDRAVHFDFHWPSGEIQADGMPTAWAYEPLGGPLLQSGRGSKRYTPRIFEVRDANLIPQWNVQWGDDRPGILTSATPWQVTLSGDQPFAYIAPLNQGLEINIGHLRTHLSPRGEMDFVVMSGPHAMFSWRYDRQHQYWRGVRHTALPPDVLKVYLSLPIAYQHKD